jgi:hypothetical protein
MVAPLALSSRGRRIRDEATEEDSKTMRHWASVPVIACHDAIPSASVVRLSMIENRDHAWIGFQTGVLFERQGCSAGTEACPTERDEVSHCLNGRVVKLCTFCQLWLYDNKAIFDFHCALASWRDYFLAGKNSKQYWMSRHFKH